MYKTRTDAIRNILTKYSLYKRALYRLEQGYITRQKFFLYTKSLIKSKNYSLLSIPVCQHLFGQYFTELYTTVKEIQRLTDYSKTFCTYHYYRLRNHILRDETLTKKYAATYLFLLLLNSNELVVMGFNIINKSNH